MLKKLNEKNLTNSLVEKIRSRIMESDLKKGAVFMTVDQISLEYGVSRTIAREAANQLQALGLLKGRKRVGLVMHRPDAQDLMKNWLPLYSRSLGGESVQSLALLRYTVELGAIGLAVANASEDQINRLKAIAAHFELVTSAVGQTEEADNIEIEFHSLVLEMTGNPLIYGMHEVLSDFFRVAVLKNPEWRKVSPDAVWEHKAIANAIALHDVELARNLLRHHLDNSLAELKGC
jgi:GntR family transcriptional regulator, transcriptional repressor for pyruvate dehydrogenase complex